MLAYNWASNLPCIIPRYLAGKFEWLDCSISGLALDGSPFHVVSQVVVRGLGLIMRLRYFLAEVEEFSTVRALS